MTGDPTRSRADALQRRLDAGEDSLARAGVDGGWYGVFLQANGEKSVVASYDAEVRMHRPLISKNLTRLQDEASRAARAMNITLWIHHFDIGEPIAELRP